MIYKSEPPSIPLDADAKTEAEMIDKLNQDRKLADECRKVRHRYKEAEANVKRLQALATQLAEFLKVALEGA